MNHLVVHNSDKTLIAFAEALTNTVGRLIKRDSKTLSILQRQETRCYGHLGLLAGIFKGKVAKGKNISIDLNDRLGEFFKNAENDPAQALMSINGFNEMPVRNPT